MRPGSLAIAGLACLSATGSPVRAGIDRNNNQQVMLGQISDADGAFYDALTALGLQNHVATFTASDFSRTLISNGRGSDHAWGGNHFVVDSGVRGRRIYGQYPSLVATWVSQRMSRRSALGLTLSA